MTLNMSSDNRKWSELKDSRGTRLSCLAGQLVPRHSTTEKVSIREAFVEFSSLTLLLIPPSSLSAHPLKDLLYQTRHISKMMYEK